MGSPEPAFRQSSRQTSLLIPSFQVCKLTAFIGLAQESGTLECVEPIVGRPET